MKKSELFSYFSAILLNTSLETYADPELSAAAYAQLRNYFLNTPKASIFESWFYWIIDKLHPEYIHSRQAARIGDLYNIAGGRAAYETLISSLVAHTAPVHRKALISQLVELSAPQGRDILRQKLCVDYEKDAHVINTPLKVVAQEAELMYANKEKSNLPYGESKRGLAWKATVSNLATTPGK